MSRCLRNHTFWSYEKCSKAGKRSWWNKAKVVALPSYWKFTRNEPDTPWSLTLNGLIRDSSRKPFQMHFPSRWYQPHKVSSLPFISRPGNLNAIIRHQGYKFGPFVTNRQKCFLRLHWSLTDNGCRPSGNVWHCEQLNLVHMKLSLSKVYWSVCVFCILLSIQWFLCDLLC